MIYKIIYLKIFSPISQSIISVLKRRVCVPRTSKPVYRTAFGEQCKWYSHWRLRTVYLSVWHIVRRLTGTVDKHLGQCGTLRGDNIFDEKNLPSVSIRPALEASECYLTWLTRLAFNAAIFTITQRSTSNAISSSAWRSPDDRSHQERDPDLMHTINNRHFSRQIIGLWYSSVITRQITILSGGTSFRTAFRRSNVSSELNLAPPNRPN